MLVLCSDIVSCLDTAISPFPLATYNFFPNSFLNDLTEIKDVFQVLYKEKHI